MPDFSRELEIERRRPGAVIAGIDEAGRGPWAGPVTAAAVVLDRERLPQALRQGLNDSKKLSAARRDALFDELHACGAALIGCASADVDEIDRLNILRATELAMARALAALTRPADHVLVDGNRAPPLPVPVSPIVRGDGLSLSIAAASIIAKVSRDRMMTALAAEFPGYGWHTNMGYGTAAHHAALRHIGLTPHHRRSFAPVRAIIAGA